jgi:hypothetical protein
LPGLKGCQSSESVMSLFVRISIRPSLISFFRDFLFFRENTQRVLEPTNHELLLPPPYDGQRQRILLQKDGSSSQMLPSLVRSAFTCSIYCTKLMPPNLAIPNLYAIQTLTSIKAATALNKSMPPERNTPLRVRGGQQIRSTSSLNTDYYYYYRRYPTSRYNRAHKAGKARCNRMSAFTAPGSHDDRRD